MGVCAAHARGQPDLLKCVARRLPCCASRKQQQAGTYASHKQHFELSGEVNWGHTSAWCRPRASVGALDSRCCFACHKGTRFPSTSAVARLRRYKEGGKWLLHHFDGPEPCKARM